MDLSRNWLSEFVDAADISDKDFCDAMTLSGSKVETARRTDAGIEKIVVGRIEAMEKHPDSDHLWVCRIDAGQGAPLQIVTGAQNQRVGDYVPVALDGALLPDGKRIEAGKLRGVDSFGMCCSWQELGMSERDWPHYPENGLFLLNRDPDLAAAGLVPGTPITKALHLDDTVVEFEITPNRPDCLSVIGLAREVLQ